MQKPVFLYPAAHTNVDYTINMKEAATISDAIERMTDPAFWSHVAPQLRPGYEIKVNALDFSWQFQLMVQSASKTDAIVWVKERFSRGVSAAAGDAAYDVKMRGPRKWSVIRKADNQVIAEDIDTREQAEAWLLDHQKALAA